MMTLSMILAAVATFVRPDAIVAPEGVKVEVTGEGVVEVQAPNGVDEVSLLWKRPLEDSARVLRDDWERTYGTAGWTTVAKNPGSAWYMMLEREGVFDGWGVEVQPNALAWWSTDRRGIALTLDLRAGSRPVRPGKRVIAAVKLVMREGRRGESAFEAGREFCRMMCPRPRLPKEPVYGYNDWYCAYGKNTATNFLADSSFVTSLAEGLANRPYVVMDDGWQKNSPPVVRPLNEGASGWGPWDEAGDAFGMKMKPFAAAVAALGAKPGLWYRPFRAWAEIPDDQRLGADRRYFDPTCPELKTRIAADIRRFRDWGMKLVKIDYLTMDLADGASYAHRCGARLVKEDYVWRRDDRTAAEVMKDLYRTMREAAGDDMVIIGCNALNHLAAGLFELQRTGGDTSGWSWAQTRERGVNTLAARAIQDRTFFAVDADCVGLAQAGAVPWEKNAQWLELVSRSGTPLFVSWKKELADDAVRAALKRAFALAAVPRATAEPLDLFDGPTPSRWRFEDGERTFDWGGAVSAAEYMADESDPYYEKIFVPARREAKTLAAESARNARAPRTRELLARERDLSRRFARLCALDGAIGCDVTTGRRLFGAVELQQRATELLWTAADSAALPPPAGSGCGKAPAFALRVADAAVACRIPETCTEGTNWFLAAAADLTNVLSKITGRAIPLYGHDDLPVGTRPVIRLGDYGAGKLKRMEFRIDAEPGRVWLRANTGSAAAMAVTEFLARYADFYFVSMFGDDDPVTENPGLVVPVGSFSKTPAVYYRKIYDGVYTQGGLADVERRRGWWPKSFDLYYAFARRTMTSSVVDEFEPSDRLSHRTKENHSSFWYVDPKKLSASHPEYFGYYRQDGKRRFGVSQTQLCYTSKGALAEAYRSLRSFIAADRAANPASYPALYDFTQQDHAGFCECERCEKLYEKYNRTKGDSRTGGATAAQLLFMNELARRIRAEYPDVTIRTFAYAQTEALPPDLPAPEPNLMFWYCDLFGFSDHLTPLAGSAFNAPRKELFERWAKYAPKLELWDYMLTGPYWASGFPEVAVDAIAADARLFASVGLHRIFCEHYPEQPFWELNQFVYGRLLCDPEEDVEKLVDRYCRLYRRGAGRMRGLIDLLRGLNREHPSTACGQWMGRAFAWRNLKDFTRIRDLAEEVWNAEDDEKVRRHVAWLLASASRELLVLAKADGDEVAYRKARADTLLYADRMKAFAPVLFEKKQRDGGFLKQFTDTVEQTDVAFGDLPEELKGQKGLVMLDYHALGARIPSTEDPDAESGRGARQTKGVDPAAKSVPFGLYDFSTKTTQRFRRDHRPIAIDGKSADGRYHWHRLGTGHVGEATILFFTSQWIPNWPLNAYHRMADGMTEDEDPNWYEMWASVKIEPDRRTIWVDRVVLRRKH